MYVVGTYWVRWLWEEWSWMQFPAVRVAVSMYQMTSNHQERVIIITLRT